ncbi:hypothetical protein ACFSYB_07810 [Litchfieldia salsa]
MYQGRDEGNVPFPTDLVTGTRDLSLGSPWLTLAQEQLLENFK